MTLFYFNIYRDGRWLRDDHGRDFPDCGMAFRAARRTIERIRQEEDLCEEARAAMALQVTYADGSELFHLPFNLGI